MKRDFVHIFGAFGSHISNERLLINVSDLLDEGSSRDVGEVESV